MSALGSFSTEAAGMVRRATSASPQERTFRSLVERHALGPLDHGPTALELAQALKLAAQGAILAAKVDELTDKFAVIRPLKPRPPMPGLHPSQAVAAGGAAVRPRWRPGP